MEGRESNRTCEIASASMIKRRGVRILVFPDVPQWFITSREGELAVSLLQDRLRKESNQRTLNGKLRKLRGRISALNFLPDDSLDTTELRALVWEATTRCNLRCSHCYVDAGRARVNELSLSEIHGLLNQLPEMGTRSFTITGGEPFLRNDILDVISFAKDLGISVIIFTNGTLINDNIARNLSNLSIDSVLVSLDGVTEKENDKVRGQGTFKEAIRSIKLLIEHGLAPSLSMTVLRSIVQDATRLLDFASSLGVENIHLDLPYLAGQLKRNQYLCPSIEEVITFFKKLMRLVRTSGIRIDYLDKIEDTLLKGARVKSCGAGRVTCYVASDGTVFPCSFLTYPGMMAGDIRTRPLRAIWEDSSRLRVFRNDLVNQISGCRGCPLRYYCSSGCRAFAFAEKGDMLSTDPYCKLHRFLFEDFMLSLAEKPRSPHNLLL